jgi:hypothetical protein
MELTVEQRDQLRRLAPDHLKAIEKINRQARSARSVKRAIAPTTTDDELVIDFSNLTERLTVGDIEDMERASGVATFEMAAFGGNVRSLLGMAALIWVLRRRDDPRYTYKKARELPASTLLRFLNEMGEAARATSDSEDEGDDPLGDNASLSA